MVRLIRALGRMVPAALLAAAPAAAMAQANVGLGGVRASFPRTNTISGGVPSPGPGLVGGATGLIGGGVLIAPGLVGSSCHLVDGSGLTVSGSFANDDLNVRFRLGSPGVLVCHPRSRVIFTGFPFQGGYFGYPYDYAYPYYSGYRNTYVGGGYTQLYDPSLVYPGLRQPAPPSQQPATPEPLTDRQIGDLGLQIRDAAGAVQAYRRHLDAHPDDAEVMRLLGLALIDNREVREGIAMIAMAYRTNPGLCNRPLPVDILGETRRHLRTNVNRVSIFANQIDSPSSWLAMAVLVQAEGRDEVARRMAERARDAGLDPELAARFIAAVTR